MILGLVLHKCGHHPLGEKSHLLIANGLVEQMVPALKPAVMVVQILVMVLAIGEHCYLQYLQMNANGQLDHNLAVQI